MTQEKLTKEDISQESLKGTKTSREEAGPKGGQEKHKISTDGHPVPPAKTLTMDEEQQSTGLTMTKVLKVPPIGGSKKLPSSELEIANPMIDKVVSTPSSE